MHNQLRQSKTINKKHITDQQLINKRTKRPTFQNQKANSPEPKGQFSRTKRLIVQHSPASANRPSHINRLKSLLSLIIGCLGFVCLFVVVAAVLVVAVALSC